MAQDLEDLILREGPETCAAFIAEPVMGAGGVIMPPKGYFQKIKPMLEKYDIRFIADEVICGFGRTGNWFGTQTYGHEAALDHHGERPSPRPISRCRPSPSRKTSIRRCWTRAASSAPSAMAIPIPPIRWAVPWR
jgi:hypothetical protein